MSQENPTLAAQTRELVGKKVRRIRKQGKVPAVLYGYNVEPTKLQLDAREFETTYKSAGRTTLVSLSVESGQPVQVFVQEVQRHPITHDAWHVDFHAVNLREAVETEVPVVLTGEAPAVHNNLGVLLRGAETVTVHALPTDIPHQIEVSVEGLANVDDALHVSDLPTDGNYQIVTEPTEMVAKITAQQLEPEVEQVVEVEEAVETEDTTEGEGDATAQ